MDLAIALSRFFQIAAGMVLLGTPLFFLYGPAPSGPWPRRLLSLAGAAGGLATLGWLMAQAANFGAPSDAFDPAKVWSVALDTGVGRAGSVRAILFLAAAVAPWATAPGRSRWLGSAGVGALVAASLARLGHGSSGDGALSAVHLAADVAHLLAAGVWIGALVPLAVLVVRSGRAAAVETDRKAAHMGLESFSGVGLAVVGTLVATGLVNSWVLVGPEHLLDLPRSAYGLGLIAKLALFGLMLCLAAANRFVLTPALARGPGRAALSALRASVVAETVLATLVLACVAVVGMQSPPAAG
ncbi:MAG TPA: copper homeostasis membrane protein CopD [Caulobacteraceae bacterium]|nr:copper homeostasis membrane protein CopD [Caulobacteraceae bacterium]